MQHRYRSGSPSTGATSNRHNEPGALRWGHIKPSQQTIQVGPGGATSNRHTGAKSNCQDQRGQATVAPLPAASRPVYDCEAANQRKIDAVQQLAPLADAFDDLETRIAELLARTNDLELG